MPQPSPPPNLPPISGNSSGSPPNANNTSPPSPGSNSSLPSVDPKAPPPSSSTPPEPAPSSNGSYSPPPNRSRPSPPPNIAALPPSSPSHAPSSPPSVSPPPSISPPDSKAAPPPPVVISPPDSKAAPPPPVVISPPDSKTAPPPPVVIPPKSKSPQGSPPSPPLPRGPPSPSTPNTSPPTKIMSPKRSPSTPSDAEQVNTPPPKASPSSPTASFSPPSPSGILSGTGTAIGISAAVLAVALVAIFFVILRKKKRGINGFSGPYKPTFGGYYPTPTDGGGHAARKDRYRASNSSQSSTAGMPCGTYMVHGYHAGPPDPAGSRSWYTYEELTEVTDGFSHNNIIGEGGFGCVYKGYLPDGRQVAVKQLKVGSGQGEREFRAEVEIISRIHHRHLVSLVGYCIAEQQRLLVYEFIPNKTLEFHLHEKRLPVLDWQKRMKIAIGSARGLAYLHEDCHPRIIHRDIKTANILVDDSFEAKVADFGLAKLSNDTNTHVSTRVMGTFGYMAPEYASSGKLTDRSDVFSFGVVLLELITGRKPVDPSQPLGDESLVEWARPLLVHVLETGDYGELVDPRLENNFVKGEMLKMIEAAAACVRHSANKRPRMVQVLRALDSEGNLVDLSNGVKFGQSTVYDSGQYSDDIEKFRKMAFESGIYNS